MKLFWILASFCVVVAGCGGGGGGGGGSGSNSGGFSQTYTSSAAAGELLQFSINTSSLTYSYTITRSSYGCEVSNSPCHTGSGTLTKNSDGSYTPSGSPSSRVFAIQNGLLVGGIQLNLNGSLRTIPIVGVSNPITSLSSLAGNYNFISLQCTSQTYGVFSGCSTYNGTYTVTSGGTFQTCTGADITAGGHVCSNSVSGTVTSLGGGLWQFQSTSPAGLSTNYLLAFTAPNGQNVAIIDFNDSAVFGYGQAIASTEVSSTNNTVSGNYVWLNDVGSSGVVTVNSNGTTSSGASYAVNSPWTGVATVTSGGSTGYAILAGNGVYVYRNPSVASYYYEVGLRIQ